MLVLSLLSFPKSVVCKILLEWVTVPCLAMVDSAMCSHEIRPKYLQLVTSSAFVLPRITVCGNTIRLVEWISMREIKSRTWEIARNSSEISGKFWALSLPTTVKLIERTGGSHVRNMDIRNAAEEILGIFSAASIVCKRIVKLQLFYCKY